jgi:hypothetical protein
VDLSQAEVDEFIAAEKVVPGGEGGPGPRRIVWAEMSPKRMLWQAPVFVAGARVATLYLIVNPRHARAWVCKLYFRKADVFEWNIKPKATKHRNMGCPADRGFAPSIKCAEHEHVWIEGHGRDCAKALDGLDEANHRDVFERFCEAARIDFHPDYESPMPQLEIQ